MNRLFGLDSPVMAFLSRLADLIWLNLLTLICCIPVVTAGAAFTALHYVCIKMVRDEDGYLTKSYFKSFKQNFLQATGMWLLFLLAALIMAVDFFFVFRMEGDFAFVLQVALSAVSLFLVCSLLYWLPLLSRFENTVLHTIKNAFLVSILNFPRTIAILVIYCAFLFFYWMFSVRILPLILLMGISLPVYLASYLFSAVFKKLEPSEEEISQSV